MGWAERQRSEFIRKGKHMHNGGDGCDRLRQAQKIDEENTKDIKRKTV